MNNSKKKNISFVLQGLCEGGADRVASILINYFCDNGYEVQVLLLYNSDIKFQIDTRAHVDFLNYGEDKRNKIKKLLSLRKNIKGDVVISFCTTTLINTAFSLIFSPKKLIISERTDPNNDEGVSNIPRLLEKKAAFYIADKCVFQTEGAKQYYPKAIQNKGVIITNPVREHGYKLYSGERNKFIVTTCRLCKQKNIPLLLDAFKVVHEKHEDYKLVIYGKGELENELIDYSKKINIYNSVIFAGFLDPEKLYGEIRKAALFVMSSDYEGVSNSLIEALSLGIPTVSTDSPPGGARSLIQNGVNGILVPVGDKKELALSMLRLIEDNDFSRKISINAYKINDNNSPKMICKEWERIVVE